VGARVEEPGDPWRTGGAAAGRHRAAVRGV